MKILFKVSFLSPICLPTDYWRSISEYGPQIEVSRCGHMYDNATKRFCKALASDVATAFLPNPAALTHVGFLDGDKSNVALTNLRWISKQPG